MPDTGVRMGLGGKHSLIVEAEWFLAQDLEATVTSAGGEVVGLFPSIEGGMAALSERVDASILDMEVRDGLIYPLAAFCGSASDAWAR